MKYDLIGIDLDGTLLDPENRVSDANRRALAAAQAAGVHVVPCTGRGWREARPVLHDVPDLKQGVFITGAAVAEMDTGNCIDFADMEPRLAKELVDFLDDGIDAVLCYREADRIGHEYLVTGDGPISDNTRWWFEMTEAVVHEQRRVTADDLRHVLRVGVVARGERLPGLTRRVQEAFGDRVLAHAFPAIQMPDPAATLHVLEVFAAGVDKWRGISWIADQRGIPRQRVAVIGDQINDLAMIRSAGCGIAMGNAVAPIQQAADRRTKTNAQDGVAYAIENLLDGAW